MGRPMMGQSALRSSTSNRTLPLSFVRLLACRHLLRHHPSLSPFPFPLQLGCSTLPFPRPCSSGTAIEREGEQRLSDEEDGDRATRSGRSALLPAEKKALTTESHSTIALEKVLDAHRGKE